MNKKTVLTGVKPTGQPHLGNFLGALRPSLKLAGQDDRLSVLFIADYHSLTSVHKGEELRDLTYDVAATWLACGLDPERTIIYKQSDVPEVLELSWILACFTPKGLMNRAHAYKAKLADNQEAGRKDPDQGVNMGLYTYPILMAADILMFSADEVPVGEDQIQHVEITRDIAQKFNRTYGEVLRIPNFVVDKASKLVMGLDGRKMSKSYGNTIPLWVPEKKLRKLVMKIKTDSSPPEAAKDPDDSLLIDLYKEFATPDEMAAMVTRYREGVAWGDVKQSLFEAINRELAPKREIYNQLMVDRSQIDKVLQQGAERARERAKVLLKRVRKTIGMD